MLSFIGKIFFPATAHPQLEPQYHAPINALHSRRSTKRATHQDRDKRSHEVAALYQGVRQRLGLKSPKQNEVSTCIPPLPGSDTSLVETDSTKSTDSVPTDECISSPASDGDTARGHSAMDPNNATSIDTQQPPPRVAAMVQGSHETLYSKDSGYASDGRGNIFRNSVANKKGKLRRMGQRLSNKYMRLLHSTPKEPCDEDLQQERKNDGLEAAANLEKGEEKENDHGDLDDGVAEDVDGEDENGQEGDDEEGAYPRCDFKTIETVSDEKLRELVSLHCVLDGDACHVQVERRCKGTYNFAAILSSSYKNVRKGFVVRIPGHATRAHWNEDDEHAMEREVQLVEHIRKNTTAPVPGILHYSTKHDNLIGFPYILMTQLPGKDAFSIWFDGDDYYNDDVELMFQHADNPSTATEAKRITFLRSLARYMTEIQTLSFEKIGMPLFTDDDEAPAVGPIYEWSADGSDTARKRGPFRTTVDYAFYGLTSQLISLSPTADKSQIGVLKFFRQVLTQSPFKAMGPETFTVYHRDLDFQNILVDEDGNITGIIDWDKAFVASRCIGAAAAPLFLQKDWLPDYLNNLDCAPHMGWKTHYYREIYAATLVEAGNPDAIFATKSAIYRSAFTAICDIDGYGKLELMDKLLREIPHCRLKSPEFARGLGLGWKDAEAMLKVELAKVLKPELPPHNLLADLDAEMTLKKWYLDFNVEDEDEDEGEDDEDEESEDSDEENEDEDTETEGEESDEESASGSECNENDGDD